MTRTRKPYWRLAILALLLLLVAAFSLSVGDSSQDLTVLWRLLTGSVSQSLTFIITEIRLPRLVVCLLGGGSLALAGTLLQTLTKNPLADSSILGINSGAGLGVTLGVAYLDTSLLSGSLTLSLFAMLAGAGTVFLTFAISQDKGTPLNPNRLILTGVGIATLLSGVMVSLISTLNEDKVAIITAWLSGTITGDNWRTIGVFAPILLLLWGLAYSRSYAHNVLALSEETAQSLGLNLRQERLANLLLAASLASISVVLVGNITFIGLLAGHLARRLIGNDHRLTMIASPMLGIIILTLADSLDRLFLVGTNIPTGLVIAIIGAPYFLTLMVKMKD